jgi:hypothetical protein
MVSSAAILQTAGGAAATAPVGFEATLHGRLASAAAKLLPEMVTSVPTLTLVLGVRMISGTIVIVVTAVSARFPVTCMAFVSTAAGLFAVPMTNEPVTTPPDTEHDGVPTMTLAGAVIVQLVSPGLNPVPETEIVFPPLPLLGVREMIGVITVKVVVVGLG